MVENLGEPVGSEDCQYKVKWKTSLVEKSW